MDGPAGLPGINQIVGETQPAIPPLSRLNCHFISFIYGGSSETPPLSSLPRKMLPFFFFPLLRSAMATNTHPFFPGNLSPTRHPKQEARSRGFQPLQAPCSVNPARKVQPEPAVSSAGGRGGRTDGRVRTPVALYHT